MQSLVAREVQFDPMSPGSHSLQVVLQIVHLTFNSWTACLCAASYHIWLSQFSILVSFFGFVRGLAHQSYISKKLVRVVYMCELVSLMNQTGKEVCHILDRSKSSHRKPTIAERSI